MKVCSKKVKKKIIKINIRHEEGSLEYLIKVFTICLVLFTFCIFKKHVSVESTLGSSSYSAGLYTVKY